MSLENPLAELLGGQENWMTARVIVDSLQDPDTTSAARVEVTAMMGEKPELIAAVLGLAAKDMAARNGLDFHEALARLISDIPKHKEEIN